MHSTELELDQRTDQRTDHQIEQRLKQQSNPYGFTLVELLVAIAIVAILSAISIPLYTTYSMRSYRAEAQADLLNCSQALERFNAMTFTYAGTADTTADGLGDANVGAVAAEVCNPLSADRYAITVNAPGATNPDTSGLAPPDPQFGGERAIRRIVFRNGALITTTVLPAANEFSCSGVRPGTMLVMNAFSGGDLEEAIIDFNTDGVVDDADLIDVDGESYSGGLLFNQDDLDGVLVDLSTLGGEGDTDFLFISGGNDTEAYRITSINEGRTGCLSWVELQDGN